MKPSTVRFIIYVSVFALIGLVFTQLFWIRQEFRLGQKQYSHQADMALADVLSELKFYCKDSAGEAHASASGPVHILETIDTLLLGNLIEKYVNYHRLDKPYFYAIIRTDNDSMVHASPGFPSIRPGVDPFKACLSAVWSKEYYHLALYFPNKDTAVLLQMGVWLSLTLLFLLIISYGVATVLISYLRQKKLTEMKQDFINNVTHEFKTPISTIALAAEVLIKTDAKTAGERLKKYARIISDENERMRIQVERVLQMAQQDQGEIRLNPSEVDVHNLIRHVVDNLCLESGNPSIRVSFGFSARQPVIVADEIYLTGILSNIAENAIKYSGATPEITITTADRPGGMIISVIDKGIGMSRDVQKHIFERFYRAHTGDVHNVKGFGLGLFYARIMTEAHGGKISVTSEPNKGSRFDVYLPVQVDVQTKRTA